MDLQNTDCSKTVSENGRPGSAEKLGIPVVRNPKAIPTRNPFRAARDPAANLSTDCKRKTIKRIQYFKDMFKFVEICRPYVFIGLYYCATFLIDDVQWSPVEKRLALCRSPSGQFRPRHRLPVQRIQIRQEGCRRCLSQMFYYSGPRPSWLSLRMSSTFSEERIG